MADAAAGYQEIPSDGMGGQTAAKGLRWAKAGVVFCSVVFLSGLCVLMNASNATSAGLDLASLPSSRLRMGTGKSPAKFTPSSFGGAGLKVQTPLGSVAGTAQIPSLSFGLSNMAQTSLSSSRSVAAQANVPKGQTYVIKQPKPLGVKFSDKGNGIYVDKVDRDADDRVKVGDKLLAVSASFGGEIWPAKSFQQTMMAINTRNGLVYLKLQSGGGKIGKGGLLGALPGFGNKAEEDRIEEVNDPEWERQVDSVAAVQTITVVAGLVGCALLAYIGLSIK